jgi:hypothetical protein
VLRLEDLEIVLGEAEPLVPPLAALPPHRVPHAREEVDVVHRIAELVGARLGDLLAPLAGARHAVLPGGVLREVAEDPVERIFPDHPLARAREHGLPVHLFDRVLLFQVILEVLDRVLLVEEAESLAQLLERAERLLHVPVGHEEEPVVEREEIALEVEVLGEALVPA